MSGLITTVVGLASAKLWYAFLHPVEPLRSTGWAVDGFLAIAPLAALLTLLALDMPIGAYLDAAAPGLFITVALGRVGCFLTGCCAGRPSAARWAIWSSDDQLGLRRGPTQLFEASVGALLGLVAVALLTVFGLGAAVAFAVPWAVYLVARHFLLRLRSERRSYLWRRSAALQHRAA